MTYLPVAPAALDLGSLAVAGPLLRLEEPVGVGPLRLTALQIDQGLEASPLPARWQRRRGTLVHAELAVEQEALSAWLQGPVGQRLRAAGVERLALRLGPSLLAITAQLLSGGRRLWLTARGRVLARGVQVGLALEGVRCHGFSPVPTAFTGHLLGQAVVRELVPAPPGWPALVEMAAPSELRGDLLRLCLLSLLPARGLRLPALSGVSLTEVRLQEGQLELRFSPPGDSTPLGQGAEPGSLVEADCLLASGETEAALAAYERLARGGAPWADLARLRRLQVLLSMPPRHGEAEALALAELERNDRTAAALLALAIIEAERGQAARAAARYVALSELADNTPEEVATAALCAAELLLPRDEKEGVRWLERAAAIPGGLASTRASALLSDHYIQAGRWQDLAHLEERLLGMAPAGPDLVRRYLRLGALYLDHVGDPAQARIAVEQALRLAPDNAAAWELKARLLEAQSPPEPQAVLAALDRAAALSPPEAAADLLLRAGALCERCGDVEGALARYRQAVACQPGTAQALERSAELLREQGRNAEARAAYESLLECAPGGEAGDGMRRRALLALSRIALADPAGRPLGRGYLGRALALGGERDPEVLLAWADLEEADGHLDAADRALGRLEDLGVRDHMLRRAEVLLRLGRAAEAIAVAERTVVLRPDQAGPALRVLARARQIMGDARGLREALERLVEIEPEDAYARTELGRVLAMGGDLAAARAQLVRAGRDPAALELLTEVLSRQRDEEALIDALSELADCLAQDPERRAVRASALGRLAELLARKGRLREAERHLEEALPLLPAEEEAAAAIGEAALLLGRYADARRAWAPLLSETRGPHPSLPLRLVRLGELGERDHPEEALADFRRALSSGARGAERARAHRGVIRLASRVALLRDPSDQGGAQEALVQALVQAAEDPRTEELAPARAALLVQAGDIRRQQERTAEAVTLYERALAIDPMSLGALDGLEQIFTRLDEPSRLAEVLAARARALSSRPAERKQVLGRLGALYAGRLGRRDLAREAYRQALALDPTYHPGLIFLAEDAHKRGDHGAELAHLKRLASLDAQAPLSAAERAEIHARLAQLHRRAGRHEEAERQALLALRYDPEHAQALALLDERYSASGRHAELAEILLRRAHVEQEAVERRDALVRRAGLLDEGLGNPQLALQAYHDLVRLAPDPAACIRLAELAAQQQAFDEIQDVAPVVGRALLDNSRAAEAIPVLLAAARRGAGEPLFALLAEAYEAIGDSDRAADAWSAAGRAADPVRRAEALVKAGRLEEAMAAWVSIASSEPALAEQARRSAATLARQAMVEHPEEAPAWARRLLEVEPQDAEALALCLRARPTEAAGLLDALGSRLATEEAAATWHAAALLLPESEQEMRRELLRRSVAVAPTPQRVLLLASLEEGPRRRQVLEAGQARFPSDPDLALALAEAAPDSALAVLEQAIAAQEGHADDGARHARTRLLCAAARWAREAGDRRAARAFLRRAGEAEEALHALVDLDRERLLEAAEGDEDDLLPVLTQLRERKLATPEELRALARLLTARGQYAEAARLHREAGGEPDELLADLETSGRYRELLVALAEHAAVLPEQARRLHRYGARIAEHHLGDRHQAAVLLEQAAFSQGPQEEAAELWAQAGALWNQLGQRERGAAALGRALTAGGEKTPGVLLALADYSFDEGDWDSAARHYRRALAVGQVPGPERGRVRLRLAAIERRRGNAVAEEQELAAAVEAGAGAQAWPALAALFRSQGEMARLGAALLAWADYESGESRLSLLRQAGALVGPTLLPRVDDELIRLDADDETVRDRVLARLRQGGDAQALAAALARDVKKSTGLRRVAAARELAALCEQLGDIVATARAWSEVLQASPEADRDAQEALGWLLRLHQAGVALPPEAMAELRVHLLERGRLQAYLAALEAEAERCRDHNPTHRAELLRMAAELCEALDDAAGAAGRWLRLCTAQGESGEALTRARHQLRRLCESERAEEALQLVEDELRRGGPGGAVGLRVAQAEILAHLGRPEEAIGHLDLALVHEPDSGPAHALLGLLLAQSSQPLESARGLPHLLLAVGAPDVEPHEAGECALCAAEILMARVDHDPHLASQLTPGTERPDPRWLLERAAELLPGDRRPLDALLHLAVEQGQDDRAVLLLEQLLHLVHEDTERSRLLVEQAAILTRLGRLDEAEAAASQAVRLSPQMYEARRAQRLVWARRGQSQQAELHCHRELEGVEDPSLRATLLLELALLRQERGDMEGAIQACVEGGQLGSSAACQEAFRILSSLGRHVEAADLAVRASHHLEEAQAGPMLLAAAAMAQKAGDVERARTCLEQACGLPSVALEAQHQLLVLEGGSDPASQRQALLSRLVEAQGQMRLALLRRLLLLALETNDDAEARVWAAELFQHSPDDDLAFRVHHRLLSQDGDPLALCQMWLRRAEGLTEPLARADALCTAASIASESLGDLTMAERHYQMALEALPGHLSAVFGLADLAYRRGDYERARALYESIPEVPPGCPDAGEILRRRGELAEAAGNQDGALSAYRQMLEVGLRLREASPSTGLDEVGAALAPDIIVRAAEELTRLHQQRGEYGEALCALRHLLPYMPEGDAEESRTRRAHLWLHLAWLALQAGELAEAESHLGGLLASDPDSRQGLLLLVELYHAMGRPLEAAQVLSRLAELAESPAERADMLYERGALIEVHLGDPAQSFQMYQQALEAVPGHAPSLRRLIVLHLREANGVGVAEAVRELEEAGQGLEDVQYLGGIGMALAGENEQADRLLRGASAEQLAQALSAIGLPPPGDLSLLDEPIAAAVRALGGTAGLPALEAALYDRLRAAPSGVDVGARQILARLAELRGEPRARVHLSVLAFLLPDGYAAQRLEVLGPAPPRTLGADPFLSSGPNPLRDALAVLGQHLHGFPEAALPLSADWGLRLRSLGHAVGLAKLDVAIVETLPAGEEPARCDPTHPPRLRLLRRLTADPAQARFAALRALRLLQFGVPLVQGRSPAEVAALLRATAWLLEPTPTPPQDPLVDSWISTLRSLPFPLESFPPKVRAEARAALSACCEQLATEPSYLETALPDFVESAQRAAERQAWAETGDLLAALRALAPWPLDEPTARLTALQMPALVQLIGFADQQS